MDLKKLAERPDLEQLVERAAEAAHQANLAYCKSIGDESQVNWADAPDWQKNSARAGVRFLIDNPGVTSAEQHDNWCEQKLADGWSYGEVKDAEKLTHPCLLPYDQLPAAQQEKDRIFREAVIVSLTSSQRPTRDLLAQAKPVARAETTQAHLDAPAAAERVATETEAPVVRPGGLVIVVKGGERIPVQVRDEQHVEQLRAAHGAKNVEVQS